MDQFEKLIDSWGHLGVFVGILCTGLGFPMPEELPIVLGGAMANSGEVSIWTMLPVCIVGVIIGDSFLYLIGRFWGARLVASPFISKRLLTPERLASISENFQTRGVRILLFARLTPGIRAPIFLVAGITKLPLAQFLIADGIYAIPGVSILFFLGYFFTRQIVDIVKISDNYLNYLRPIIVLVVLACVGFYFLYRFVRKPMVEGNPTEMPPIVGQVTTAAESVADKMLHISKHPETEEAAKKKAEEAAKKKAEEEAAKTKPPKPSESNGQVHSNADEQKPKEPTADGRQ